MQQIRGQQATAENHDIIFPPDFEQFEASRANLVEERLDAEVVRGFFDELTRRRPSDRGIKVYNRLAETLGYRDLFITEQGHLGFGMNTLELGDEIWVLAGVKVPLILRRQTGQGQYRLIGESYVHGIMHGEAVDDKVQEKISSVILI